jgi:hypothetical protein
MATVHSPQVPIRYGSITAAEPVFRDTQTGIVVAVPSSLHIGDHALILGGPFAGKVGTITRLDSESATVVCDVFDRDTPVEVDRNDIEPPPPPGTSGDPEPRRPTPSTDYAGAETEPRT